MQNPPRDRMAQVRPWKDRPYNRARDRKAGVTDLAIARHRSVPLGSLVSDERYGRVFRMRYYKNTRNDTPPQLRLPCCAVAIFGINAARIIRIISHLDTDERYDYFSFEETGLSPALREFEETAPFAIPRWSLAVPQKANP